MERPPITADEVYVAVLDLVAGQGLSLAEAAADVAGSMEVDPAAVIETTLVVARRERSEDLFGVRGTAGPRR